MANDDKQSRLQQQQMKTTQGVDLFETVDWSCCCCSRRTGILVLGVCFLALSLVALVLCSVTVSKIGAERQLNITLSSIMPTEKPSGTTAKPQLKLHPSVEMYFNMTLAAEREVVEGVRGLLLAQAVVSAAGALTAILLLGGAWLSRPAALLPWMVCGVTEVALLITGGLYCVIISMARKLPVLELEGFFVMVIMWIFCIPVVYCVLAVGTFYKELKGSRYAECVKSPDEESHTRSLRRRPAVPPPAPPPQHRPRLNSEGHSNPGFENTAL